MNAPPPQSFYHKAFFWTAAGLLLAVWVLYPHFCDGVDPDATAYFTLARRWANGDFTRAVNGYWSPLSIWLTALLMRCGLAEVPAAFVQNTAGAGLFLGASLALFRQFGVRPKDLFWTVPALGFFLLHAVFHQWFSDLWGAAFALLALWLLLTDGFFRRPHHWLLYGLLGALAYLSKSLYLPFFGLQTLLAAGLGREVLPLRRWGFILLGFGVLVLTCLPWWAALRVHYGFWTTGVAGPLNLSWGVLGKPLFKGGEGQLLPPVYADSVSFWEDPWWVNARIVHFWDSAALWWNMLPRFGYFLLRLLQKSVLLSFLLPVAILETARRLFQNRFRLPGDFKAQMLQIVLLTFPLPFLMLHSEVRYLWVLAPLVVVFMHHFLTSRFHSRGVTALVALSLCIHGLVSFPQLWHLGRWEKAFAARLKGPAPGDDFAATPAISYGAALRVAYFSGMRYWAPTGPLDTAALNAQLQKHRIRYVLQKGGK